MSQELRFDGRVAIVTGAARILRSACFDGAMGGGRQTEQCDTPGPWTLPGDASASMAKLRIVCGP